MAMNEVVKFRNLRHDEEGRYLLDGNLFTGVAVDYRPDGSKATEVSFRDGIQHGLMIGWHPNGVKRSETMYVEGRAEGVRREWYDNGQLKLENTIGKRGELLASKQWDETGILVSSQP